MATRLFLHNALFDTVAFPGSYPDVSGELQAVVPSPAPSYSQSGADTVATHRSMNKTKGISQTSRGVTSQALNGSTQTNYITKFISDPLKNVTTIDAEIWSSMSAKLQTSSSSAYAGAIVALYVWRPSSNSRVGSNIYSWSGEGGFAQPTTINTERLSKGNFTAGTGAQVTGVLDNDVIIFEVYNRKTQSASGPFVDQWYFDGTNEHNSDATQTIVSSVASYIETPQNLSFVTDQITGTSDYKDILKQRPQQLITNSI